MTYLIQQKSKNYWLKPNQIKTQLMNKETNAFNNERYQEPDIYQVNVRKPDGTEKRQIQTQLCLT
jgi:hypothetical protein